MSDTNVDTPALDAPAAPTPELHWDPRLEEEESTAEAEEVLRPSRGDAAIAPRERLLKKTPMERWIKAIARDVAKELSIDHPVLFKKEAKELLCRAAEEVAREFILDAVMHCRLGGGTQILDAHVSRAKLLPSGGRASEILAKLEAERS